MNDVTRILAALEAGDEAAPDRLMEAVYQELHRVAAAKLSRERVDLTLQATALVHEAWLRLSGSSSPNWENRRHFFAAAAEAMRRILVERARRRMRLKHGGAHVRQVLDEAMVSTPGGISIDLLALDEALAKLTADDARKAKLVELRYFAGLSIPEAAKVLDISKATADRWWAYARAFLYHEVSGGDEPSSG
jgi:RNA polymerase sigma factor (TIGR02999 family)